MATRSGGRRFNQRMARMAKEVDRAVEEAVREALQDARKVRAEALEKMLGAHLGPEDWRAYHLTNLRQQLEQAIDELAHRYRLQLPGLQRRIADQAEKAFGEGLIELEAGMAPSPFVSQQLIGVLQTYSADLVDGLAAEAKQRLARTISRAALGATSPFEAMQEITGTLPGKSTFATLEQRSEAVFRTEANRAADAATHVRILEQAEHLPGLKKKWIAIVDSRVRASHKEANGQIVDAKGMFVVGGHSCLYPRDPNLPASESVNCRCHMVPWVDNEVLENLGVTVFVG